MTKQSENGSEVTAPQTNISASESGVSSEVKTPENKPSEGLLKGVELLLAIIGIVVKLVIDLLKKVVKIPKLLHKYRLLIKIYHRKYCRRSLKKLLLMQILKKT